MTTTEINKRDFMNRVSALAQTVRQPQQRITKDEKHEIVERAVKQLKIQRQDPTRKNLESEVLKQSRMEAIKRTEQMIYAGFIQRLKDFVDGDFKGEPLQLIVESPYTDPRIGIPQDRIYLASYGHTPDYEQVIFDQLKKYNLVQDNSQLTDYSFLFPKRV